MENIKKVTLTVDGKSIEIDLSEEQVKTLLSKESKEIPLAKVELGSIVKIGSYEWIVLNKSANSVVAITKECVKEMAFSKDNNYVTSNVREYLNNEFAKNLMEKIGKENLKWQIADLQPDDGTELYKWDGNLDYACLLSCNQYRAYRRFLEPIDKTWWTCTPVSSGNSSYYIRCVNRFGILNDISYAREIGVRPYCVFNSSLLVEKGR